MENREQPLNRVPTELEESGEITATDKAGNGLPSESAPQAEAEAANGDEVELTPIEGQEAAVPEPEPAGAGEEGLSAAEIAQVLIDLSDAQERSAKLTEEKKLIYEQLMRRQAEFENYRKRVDRERTEIYAKARAEIVTDLLPVLDNLERALGSGAQIDSGDAVRDGIVTGVKLIHRQFLDVLSGLGLSPVKAVGEPFDPHMHEAVTTETNNELPENTVIEELQRGYKLGDRLLRPAMVKVSVRG